MWSVRFSMVGGVCAILTVVAFVAGGVLMGSGGVDTLIPEPGSSGRDWVVDVDAAGNQFFVGAWLIVLMGLLGVVALIAFFDVLRAAGPVLILAPALSVLALTLVTVSHLLPIAIADDLVPAYVAGGRLGQAPLGGTFDTLASLSLATNLAGDFVLWGVVIPLYSAAILTTRVIPRWIGWLGLAVGLLGGWVGIFGPLSPVLEGISGFGFLGFFVFMLAMGVAMLRLTLASRVSPRPGLTPSPG
jgi:hypothetical protein